MSFSQFLIKSHHEYDDFALSWQVGIAGSQGLAKLKNYDIENVDVIKTCEKLNSTLQSTKRCIDELQGHKDSENKYAAKISNIPFRAVTSILFGTLKIYQQQVNNLFCLSKDLVVRSTKNNFHLLKAIKRKSSLKYGKDIKTRRLAISNSNEKELISSNYSQLIEELENLTQEAALNSMDECSSYALNTFGVAQAQIREITIREVSTTVFTTNEVEEDSGFGEATHEDMEYFLNFNGDNINQELRKVGNIPEKRKCSADHERPIKLCRYSFVRDYLPEETISNNEILTKHKCPVSPFNKFASPVKVSFHELKSSDNIKTLVKENNDYKNKDSTIAIIKDIKEEIENYSYVKPNFNKMINKKNKKSKLIIDVCTKIDINDILDAMKKTKPTIKSSRKTLLRFFKPKKFATALDLLNRFNRRSLKLSQTLKKKVYYTNEQFKKDYLDILRNIFKSNYNEKLPSEIYPNWLYSSKAKILKKKHLEKECTKEVNYQQEIDLNNSNCYLNTVTTTQNSLHNGLINLLSNGNNDENNNMATCYDQYEWRPYGVMMKLLNLWRCHQAAEIEAVVLFKLTENRFDNALGFYSLLMLSKSRFVVLSTFPETIIMHKILMGDATKTVAKISSL